MQELLARVRELLAGSPSRLAALETHGPDKDPLAALAKVFEGEVAAESKRAEDALATHAAYKAAEATWLGLADGEDVAAGRVRMDALAKVGEAMFGRMVDEWATQRTRAKLPATDADKALAQLMTPDQLEAETKALKARADADFPTGRITDPDVASRAGADQPAPRRPRRMARV